MTRGTAQLIVVLGIFGLWGFGILLAVFDGTELAKALTPIATTLLGWLFAAKATGE